MGLVSFFLIVYYQNQSSITRGSFTLLINRVGDSFFLVSIVLLIYYSSSLFVFSSLIPSELVLLILIITFITKRAIYPFSPWLPLAIAAPTPISALVHSSTLVTAGLYLFVRFSYIFYSSYLIINVLLVLRIFTSFYAGLNAVVEKDIKKLIALSTLSHLGFIGIAFSSGLLVLAFFHMLTHALFKSLLFITIGDIITNINHSQDIRYLSSGIKYTPFSTIIMYVSLLNLLGLPSLRGFFSKDLILESINYTNFSLFLNIIMFINVFFTYYYTYTLLYFSIQSNKIRRYMIFHKTISLHNILLLLLRIARLFFGYFFMKSCFSFLIFVSVPNLNKLLPIYINVLVLISLLLNAKIFTFNNIYLVDYFSNIMFLSNFIIRLIRRLYLQFRCNLVKTMEYGVLNYIINTTPYNIIRKLTSFYFILSNYKPINMIIFSLFFVIFMFLFI